MPRTYRPYEFVCDVPYVGRNELIIKYLDKRIGDISVDEELIRDTINSSLSGINSKFCLVHNHIDSAKDEILCHTGGCGCVCNLATKQDVMDAVNTITSHITLKFDEVDIPGHFIDINQQLANLNNH